MYEFVPADLRSPQTLPWIGKTEFAGTVELPSQVTTHVNIDTKYTLNSYSNWSYNNLRERVAPYAHPSLCSGVLIS